MTENILEIFKSVFQPVVRKETDIVPGAQLTKSQKRDLQENEQAAKVWGYEVLHRVCKRHPDCVEDFM